VSSLALIVTWPTADNVIEYVRRIKTNNIKKEKNNE